MPRKPPPNASVVDLSKARAARRLVTYQSKIARVVESNRRAVTGLCASGTLFTREGARAGRALLLAHQNLLEAVSLLNCLADEGEIPAPRSAAGVDELTLRLDRLLEKVSSLTNRTDRYLARLRTEWRRP